MKLTWRISCNSWDTSTYMTSMYAWYRVVVIGNNEKQHSSATWIANIIAHEDCHANQIWHSRYFTISSNWTTETECAVIGIDVLKKVNAPQDEIDWAQHFIDEHIQCSVFAAML